ncbi:MAG TPA: hypothetical protein VG478_08710 [Acidimicrobiales bacterium]|nr:hypothetical protein [Acidimicrobiales bacterium]
MSGRASGAPGRRVRGGRRGVAAAVSIALAGALVACSGDDGALNVDFDQQVERTTPGSDAAAAAEIVIHTDRPLAPLDERLLGTNVPAWVGPDRLADDGFVRTTLASGATVLRMPGGSWSNHYDWLGCQLGDEELCFWPWAARPSDFLGFLAETGLQGMWTVSMNGTAEEAAALVAFFNGEVDDDRPIGRDRRGRDWKTVGEWARLRAENGHPEPVPIRTWEVGNEIYGAVADAGPECASFGWENVWTCDGTEYVEGTAEHDGFLRFREAMLAVDPDIEVGAVGIAEQGEWGDWGNEVMSAAGEAIDFYVVHHYAFDDSVALDDVRRIPAEAWSGIAADVRDGLARNGVSDATEIAVTEYNLVSFIENEDARWMTTAVNAFYLADTIGQMARNGVQIANQWNLVNGRADNGGDYGLVDNDSGAPYPAFFAIALWSRFGDELVEVDVAERSEVTELQIHGGRDAGGSPSALVINPSDEAITASVAAEPATSAEVTADVMVSESAEAGAVTFNGVAGSGTELAAPAALAADEDGRVTHEFPAFSITLLRWRA